MCERMGLAVWTIASAFLVFLALSHGLPWIVVVFGSGLVALVVGWICVYLITRRQRLARWESERQQRRSQRSKLLSESLELTDKPDFESRLRSFSESDTGADEDFSSGMEFWQKESLHAKTPTRPQSLFRYLLKRISRLVQSGR